VCDTAAPLANILIRTFDGCNLLRMVRLEKRSYFQI